MSRLAQTVRGLIRRPFLVTDSTLPRAARRDRVVDAAAAMTLENLECRRLMAAGALDPTFGTGGIARTDFVGPANDAATRLVNVGGRLLAIGSADGRVLLAAYHTDGSVDTTFGAGGILVGGSGDVSTFGPTEFFVGHFDGNGVQDALFGTGGATALTTGNDYSMAAVNGNAFALGDNAFTTSADSDLLLARFVAVGSPGEGAQDLSFGTAGFVTDGAIVSKPDAGVAMATQADGKVLMLGTSDQATGTMTVVTRYTTSGAADTTFGNGGSILFDFGGDVPTGIAVTTDGHILVSGAGGDVNIYNGSGAAIGSFNVGSPISAIAASGNDVYVGGPVASVIAPGGSAFGVSKWSSAGVQDTVFGTAVADFSTVGNPTGAQPARVSILSDGHIVVAGGVSGDFGVARFDSNGALDGTFGSGGLARAGQSGLAAASAAVGPSGAVVVAGVDLATGQLTLGRFTSTGQLDAAFSGDGIATIATADPAQTASVTIAADGKTIIAAQIDEPTGGSHILVARLLADGTLDTSFDGDGIVTTSIGRNAGAAGVAIDANQNILVGGTGDDDIVVARYDAGIVVGPPPGATLQADPLNPGKSLLVVNGTGNGDTITISAATAGVSVSLNGANLGAFAPTGGRILVNGGDGNDNIQVSNNVSLNVDLIGGAGNDTLGGGSGADIIVGGDGNDSITGGNGRDLLIGGDGADVIDGNTQDDILIAGTTSYDNDLPSLHLVMAEWNSGRSYDQRVANIRGDDNATFVQRLNGNVFLRVGPTGVTVFDDQDVDTLSGDQGTDWFFFNNDSSVGDVILDLKKQETTTTTTT